MKEFWMNKNCTLPDDGFNEISQRIRPLSLDQGLNSLITRVWSLQRDKINPILQWLHEGKWVPIPKTSARVASSWPLSLPSLPFINFTSKLIKVTHLPLNRQEHWIIKKEIMLAYTAWWLLYLKIEFWTNNTKHNCTRVYQFNWNLTANNYPRLNLFCMPKISWKWVHFTHEIQPRVSFL